MKIKTDFVTNSSSSSFVVIGSYIPTDELSEEVFHNIKKKITPTMEDVIDDPYEYFEPLLQGTSLEWSQGCEYGVGEIMVGMPYTSMQDDETLGEFKQRVQEQIKKVFNFDLPPSHIEECWMDN